MKIVSNIFTAFWLAFPIIVWYNYIGKEVLSAMTWEMVVSIIIAVIGLISAAIISSYKEAKQTRDSKDEILNNQRDIEKAFTTSYQRTSEKLSDEHRKILDKQKDITTYILAEYDKRKLREDSFTQAQKDTQRKVEEINDFLNDWKRLTVENAELKAEINILKQENYALRAENDTLHSDEEQHEP